MPDRQGRVSLGFFVAFPGDSGSSEKAAADKLKEDAEYRAGV